MGTGVSATTASSGIYTWYQDPNHPTIGIQSAAPGASAFTTAQDCLDACDDDGWCAGVILLPTAQPENTPKTCLLIRGDATTGVHKRSMTRADIARLTLPAI
jgi:hypothetical protein